MELSDLTTRHTLTAWIAALWSGEYDKVQGALQIENGFCVQGVLADQLAKLDLGEWRYSKQSERYAFDRDEEMVRSEYQKAAGIDHEISLAELLEYAPSDYSSELSITSLERSENPLLRSLYRFNDFTSVTFEDLGHVIYNVADDQMDVDLPPKEEIKALADDGSCDLQGEEGEADFSFEQLADPERTDGPFVVAN